MFTLAIAGRTNVGKSTLFNRLCGKALALVKNHRGVSRDRNEAAGSIGSMDFRVIDTAGWEGDSSESSLEHKMTRQSEVAIVEADVCLFMVDGREGVTEMDKMLAQRLRVLGIPTILLINKCEAMRARKGFDNEFYKLGFKVIVPMSVEHNEGMNLLYDALEPYYGKYIEENRDYGEESGDDEPIRVIVLGQPNVGKSTLINRMLEQERLLTSPEAGTTRDSVVIDWRWGGRKIKIVDTAGIRKKYKAGPELEQLAVAKSLWNLNYAHVVVLVLDALEPFGRQDLSLASRVIEEEGRGLVFALNKADLVKDWKKEEQLIKIAVDGNPRILDGVPIVPISAKEGFNLEELMKAVFKVFESWNKRMPTGKLNRWLREVEVEHTPPLFRGRPTRLKYIRQIKTRPPTFVLSTNSPGTLREKTTYSWFLSNRLKKDFDMRDTPIRLVLKKAKNPYDPSIGQK
ncbi:MAG: ribosome biogenesis GTPase Der [Rickettsiales bacterium]|nr:ribosome biogenesis GTPase Der [Rickettsiales bacterium]